MVGMAPRCSPVSSGACTRGGSKVGGRLTTNCGQTLLTANMYNSINPEKSWWIFTWSPRTTGFWRIRSLTIWLCSSSENSGPRKSSCFPWNKKAAVGKRKAGLSNRRHAQNTAQREPCSPKKTLRQNFLWEFRSFPFSRSVCGFALKSEAGFSKPARDTAWQSLALSPVGVDSHQRE